MAALYLSCVRCKTSWWLSPIPCRITGLLRRMKVSICPMCKSGTREHVLEQRDK